MSGWHTTPKTEQYTRTTDCSTCGKSKRECDDSRARGWDNCCMGCDEIGSRRSHQTLTVAEVTS